MKMLAVLAALFCLCVPVPGNDTWTFTPRTDAFGTNALLDLRPLNERVAGEKGWMYAKDGKLYIPGSTTPFRGWSAGLRPFGFSYGRDELAYTARAYAKLGINQVREMSDANADVLPRPDAADITRVNRDGLDKLHRLVAAMKAEGIYVTYCPWWIQGHWRVVNNPKVPGYVGSGKPFYWCKDLQELAKGWYRQILTTTNPYTGVALADDPAVNIIELQNEENLFFHGLSSNCCDAVRWRELRAQFTAFVRGKHGSLDNAAAAWQLSAVERTNVFEGAGDAAMLRPIESWFMVREALKWMSPAMNRYAGDLIEFVTQLEREYNGEIARFIKKECGYKGLILGGDWAPCDAALLNDLARYATLPPGTDCIGYHQYSASFHLNPRNRSLSGYRIGPGDYFADGSVLANPRLIPTNYKRMRAVPMICTEMGLPGPNRFALEGQLAAAAYGSLQDFDQITWLQVEWNGYGNNMGGGTINKFNHNWPQIMGQFPGASLLFRNGCVREAPVVVSYQRPVSAYAAKQFPPILDIQNGDPLYHFGDDEKKTVDPAGAPLPGGADPLAFQVGAIEYSIGEPAETTIDTNVLESCINRSNKTVRSITGELALDWGRQLLTINTPCAQGAVGLLAAAKKVELADVTIDCHNDLAAVLVISLDGTPLAKAPRILVQAVTDAHLTGWDAPVLPAGTMVQVAQGGKTQTIALPPGARRIDNMGHQPFEIARVHGTITFRTRSVVNAQPLDLYGYPQGTPAAIVAGDAGASVPLPEDTYFTIVR